MGSDEAASVAVAVLFGLALIACVISKKTAGFRLHLLLGLSCALRCIGFATRAAQLDQPTNTDLAAVSLVFRQAGYGISIAVLCILSGCYFKNARNEMRPPRSFPLWSVGVRLLIAPVIVFGPIMGIAIASLVYGVSTPDSIHTANKLRKGSSWTFLGVVTILHTLANIAAVYVLRWQHSAANADVEAQQAGAGSHKLRRSGSLRRMNTTMRLAVRHDHSWVHMLQALCVLLQLSTIFRVVALYHPQYSTNPNLFYPLQVLPELLYVLLLLLPTVMVRVGMLDKYAAFAAAVRAGQPYVPPVAASDTNGMHDAKHATTDIEANGSRS